MKPPLRVYLVDVSRMDMVQSRGDLLREWQSVSRMEVVDRSTPFTQLYAGFDAGLDIAIGLINSFRHAHTGGKIACDRGCRVSAS